MSDEIPNWWETDPFEEDGDLERYQETGSFQDWLDANGVDDYYNLVINFEDADPSSLRGQVFFSVEEALQWLYDTGLISFSRVVGREDEDTGDLSYLVEVGDSGAYAATN